jgi:CheY-like chemotaxis protein
LHLSVLDNGNGLPRDRLDHLFDMFDAQDPTMAKDHADTGLGLAVCKRLADAMGGHLWAESEVGRGSRLHFELPTQSTTMPPLEGHPATSGLVPNVRVLLVEDNPINQRVAAKLLERIGVHPDLASNGHEALAALRQKDYDVVLMDVQMPVLDGLSTTKALRAGEPAGSHVQVIAMTAHAMPGDREQCLLAGMDDYIAKPVRLEELSEAVAKATRRAGLVA